MRTAMPDRRLGAAAHVLHQRGGSRALLFGLLGVLISNAAAQDDAGSGTGEAGGCAAAVRPSSSGSGDRCWKLVRKSVRTSPPGT